MKAVEKNISRHENGVLYFVARRGGKLIWRSLRNKNLEQARRLVREEGIQGLIAAREPQAVPLPVAVSPSPRASGAGEALEEHDRGLVLMSGGAREMAARGHRAVKRYCKSWEVFSPVEVWNSYRRSGFERPGGQELTSAANHLRWYLRKLIPWLISKGIVSEAVREELARIPKVKIPPRRIRVPEPAAVDEFLRMVTIEDADGAAFLRFLAATGLRSGMAAD